MKKMCALISITIYFIFLYLRQAPLSYLEILYIFWKENGGCSKTISVVLDVILCYIHRETGGYFEYTFFIVFRTVIGFLERTYAFGIETVASQKPANR